MKLEIGAATLYRGDCLDVLPQLGPVDMVLSDPPYGTTECRWDSAIPFDAMWAALKTVRNDRTPVLLMAQTPFDKALGASNLRELKYEWIWEKGIATGFLNAKKMPLKAHENVLVFYRSLPAYNPQMTSAERYLRVRRPGRSQVYGQQDKATAYDSTERYPRSVQKLSTERGHHPTQKPVALMEYFIKTYTDPGDTVLDFTMGSGTTGVAALNAGRRFIGIELDHTYFGTACQRIGEAAK